MNINSTEGEQAEMKKIHTLCASNLCCSHTSIGVAANPCHLVQPRMEYGHLCPVHGYLHLFRVTALLSRRDRSMTRGAVESVGPPSLHSRRHHGQATSLQCRNGRFLLRNARRSSHACLDNSRSRHTRLITLRSPAFHSSMPQLMRFGESHPVRRHSRPRQVVTEQCRHSP